VKVLQCKNADFLKSELFTQTW